MASRARRLMRAKRAQAALAANAVSSVGNLILAVVVARNGSLRELGEFAVAFSVYALVTGLARAAVTESVLGLPPEPELFRNAARRASMVGILCGALVVTIGATLTSRYLVITGLCLPGAVLYDYVKAIGLGVDRFRRACLQELIWTALTVAVAVPALFHVVSGLTVFAWWAGTGALIGYVCALSLGYPVAPGWGAGRRETTVAVTFGLDFLAGSGSAQLTTNVLAGAVGTAVVGAIRGAGTALGPVSLLVATARSLLIPYLARGKGTAADARLRAALMVTGLLIVLAIPPAVAVSFMPDAFGRALLGSNWAVAKPLLPVLACELLLSVATTVAFSGHRVQRAGGRTLVIRATTAPARLLAVVAGGLSFGAQGAAVAMALMALVGAVTWWWSYAGLLRRTEKPRCL